MTIAAQAAWVVAMCLVTLLPLPSASAGDLQAELHTLKSVQAFGQGNEQANRAWQRLSQHPASDIPAILAGMDDAGPLAANWCRAAVDAIAERALKNGGQLPAAQLEAFAKDASHASKPRELAFDWLTRVDATAADRLIPQMLDDPALPFRRRAVSRLIEAAEAATQQKHQSQALALYRQAFEKSRDIDQVRELADKLKELGQPVDVTDHLGFIVRWKLIGPFDNTSSRAFDVVYPPEQEFEPRAEYQGKSGMVRWIDHDTSDLYGLVDLNKALGKANGVVAYAVTEFLAPDERDVEVRTGTGNANKVWLNGQLLTESRPYHGNDEIDQYIGRGRLKPGRNLILIKVLQNEQTESWAQKWEFQCRVCDSVGTAVLSLDRPKNQPAPNAVSTAR
jgi:hypothetical protein